MKDETDHFNEWLTQRPVAPPTYRPELFYPEEESGFERTYAFLITCMFWGLAMATVLTRLPEDGGLRLIVMTLMMVGLCLCYLWWPAIYRAWHGVASFVRLVVHRRTSGWDDYLHALDDWWAHGAQHFAVLAQKDARVWRTLDEIQLELQAEGLEPCAVPVPG